MSFDLSELLRDWPYEPGKLQVRKITGADGREKLQLRLDMGVLQMEVLGRPDGHQPDDAESLLELHKERAREQGADFKLTAEEVGELQAEGIQYYHRYLAFFQLQDWAGVVRDTKRNLDMFSFVSKHSPDEELAWTVEQFRPYVLMMNTRAKANLALEKQDVEAAVALVQKGIGAIEKFLRDAGRDENDGDNAEVSGLKEWLKELRKAAPASTAKAPKPLTLLEQMHRDMEKAVRAEQYERAAELRDAIRALQEKQ
jgi:hypothetical protein